ncbi:MAG: hypothetical protein ACYS9X_09600 [Planctomycetota bacterium]|jgi:hypothetical protein
MPCPVEEAPRDRRARYALAATVCVLICCGCPRAGWYGVGAARLWPDELPGAVADPGRGYGFELSWDHFLTAKLGHYVPERGRGLTAVSTGINPASVFIASGPHDERMWLVAEPVLGFWAWGDAPEEFGFLTGARLGYRAIRSLKGKHRMAGIVLSWQHLWLNDAAGNADAEFETAGVAFELFW